MKTLVLGAKGLAGAHVHGYLSALADEEDEIRGLDRLQCDVRDRGMVADVVGAFEPGVIVNCAGFSGPEDAERDPNQAVAVNEIGAANVAGAARRARARLVHLSCDLVYPDEGSFGKHPNVRIPSGISDDPQSLERFERWSPSGVYARSKLDGDRRVLRECPSATVLRFGALYGPEGRNPMSRVTEACARGKVVLLDAERMVSPTSGFSLARAVAACLDHPGLAGVVHHRCSGWVSELMFGKLVAGLLGVPNAPVYELHEGVLPSGDVRPRVAIEPVRFRRAGVTTPTWEQEVAEVVEFELRYGRFVDVLSPPEIVTS